MLRVSVQLNIPRSDVLLREPIQMPGVFGKMNIGTNIRKGENAGSRIRTDELLRE
jgi:hypothetical protein